MKKLILTLFASAALVSCSTNSSSDNSSSGGLLLKSVNDGSSSGVITFNYNGNKLINATDSTGDIFTMTYSGDLIIKQENSPSSPHHYINTYNYINNLLVSSTNNYSTSSSLSNFTYNPDGSITENMTYTDLSQNFTFNDMTKRYYSQGNCIKKEEYSDVNNVMTLNSTTTYTYDANNSPFKNITGFSAWQNASGTSVKNNETGAITKNSSGVITRISQTIYQYNSQNYPISGIETSTPYTTNSFTGTIPGTPTITTSLLTYY